MCGIAGVHNHPESANIAYLCLYAQQHRGQESCGIVTSEEDFFHQHKAMGEVAENFDNEILARLPGKNAIGHVRYSTAGSSSIENAQPFVVNSHLGSLAIAHNGNLTNAIKLRNELERDGAIFQSSMDSEVIMHLIAREREGSLVEKIATALRRVEGAYSLTFLSDGIMVAARDPKGMRPLAIGQLGNSYVVVSETCALDLIDATYVREVEPGEVVLFEDGKMSSFNMVSNGTKKKAHCIFEYIYFSRPDSHVFDRDVYPIRKGFGRMLAREHPVEADLVIPVPDSGVPAAIGYAQESGIPFELGLIRNHYVGRTFIEPKNEIRHFGVRIKLNPVDEILKDKRIVVVDDSIVRGTTSMKIVKMLRRAGAKEVHVRISSPPTTWPCFYGIDTPNRKELIAAQKSVNETCDFLTADSLGYLSQDGLYFFEKKGEREWFCDACFTGNYPVDLTDTPKIMEETMEMRRRG